MQNVLIDGRSVKAVSLWGSEGWNIISGPKDDDGDSDADLMTLRRRVPWLGRAIDALAQGVASVPFVLLDKAGKEIDNSGDWQNKCGFLPNPERLLMQIEASLVIYNTAYLFNEANKSRYTQDLKYCKPASISVKTDKLPLIVERATGAGTQLTKKEYTLDPADPKVICPVVYFWKPDPDVELGPCPEGAPAWKALSAASVMYNKDRYISAFFAHGAIKTTILSIDTNDREEAEGLKQRWIDMATSIKNAWKALVVRAKQVVPTIVGSGLEDLKENGLTQQAREDISTALGIPQTKLFSNAANFASKNADDVQFYRETIIPDCKFIASVLNDQVLIPQGLRLVFKPESMDIFQEDEVSRAQSMNAFVDWLTKCPTAEIALETAATFGYSLTDKLVAAINKWFAQKTERADTLVTNLTKPKEEPQPTEQQPPQQPEQPPADQPQDNSETRAILAAWKRKAIKAIEKGESANVEFTTTVLPAKLCEVLRYELDVCTTTAEVKAVFANALIDPIPAKLERDLAEANRLLERALAA